MAKTPIFETQACTRCGGSGNYSYCQMHGTVCFQCGGSKVQLTKRGHAAQVFYNNLLTKPASEFKVGESYRMQGDPKAYRIEEIKDDPLNPGLIQLNGSGMSYGTQPGTPLRSVPTTEVRDAARAKALEYQASLNSRGKPAKMKRTDAAAPSVIDPAAFTFVAGVYFGSNPGEDFDALLGEWMQEKCLHDDDKAGWYSKKPKVLEDFPPLNPAGNFARKGTCDHCGARFDWGAVYVHTSGKHIVVGNTCADGTLSVPDRATLNTQRMKSRLEAQRKAFKMTVLACEQAITGDFVWLYAEKHEHKTLSDIAHKGLAWGSITDRQLELVNSIRFGVKAQWVVDKEARLAERAAADKARADAEANAKPVPDTGDRIKVTGEVLTVREQEGYMGALVRKMLVRTTEGFKLWGTVPSALYDVDRGATVEFSCTVERSKDDAKFGFFSRPTKPRVVPAAPAAEQTVAA
jgi:hypothetical protein